MSSTSSTCDRMARNSTTDVVTYHADVIIIDTSRKLGLEIDLPRYPTTHVTRLPFYYSRYRTYNIVKLTLIFSLGQVVIVVALSKYRRRFYCRHVTHSFDSGPVRRWFLRGCRVGRPPPSDDRPNHKVWLFFTHTFTSPSSIKTPKISKTRAFGWHTAAVGVIP